MTAPFPSNGAWGAADSNLDRLLSQFDVKHDDVQCPRADNERSIAVMRKKAIDFNSMAGNKIVDLDWKP